MFRKVLIANRGEIAARVVRTLRRMGIASVAVYSRRTASRGPLLDADEAVAIGPSPAKESYLDIDAIIAAAKATGAEAVHPGYGFLSENADFAERLARGGHPLHRAEAGASPRFRPEAHSAGAGRSLGGAAPARQRPARPRTAEAIAAAEAVGYPVMLKSTAGGGGIGMQLCHDAAELAARFEAVTRMAGSSFGDARVYLERFVA